MLFTLPFSQTPLRWEMNDKGLLQRLELAGKTYVSRDEAWTVFDSGWFRYREFWLGRHLLRQVDALPGTWLETYAFDSLGRPTEVDGVQVTRNEHGYVTHCSFEEDLWTYVYQDHQLLEIHGPRGSRQIDVSQERRPRLVSQAGNSQTFSYDQGNQRMDHPKPPSNWHRDDLGRLWEVTDTHGNIIQTYLWWGFACLGRIDGPPGYPLAAIFSLDATLTPVRVTTPTAARRFPRDAFGENLTVDPSVPGLFGGAQDGRFCHYRARVLDPKLGYFTAPDPWDGSANDPRRRGGHRGPLPVEIPPGGPYCVCQHDPVGRLDPTGEMSAAAATVFSTLGSLTWGFQNNMIGMNLGLWNILLSLLSFNGKVIKRIGDVESLYSRYTGAWGVRAHPSGIELFGINRGRAWVMQHIVWSRGQEFAIRRGARVFVPASRWNPDLYDSVLWMQPKHGTQPQYPGMDFVLCGSRFFVAPPDQVPGYAPSWTRGGGIGEPVFPGSITPHFPKGGLHFNYLHDVHAPVKGSLTEVFPDGEIYKGLIRTRQLIETDDLKAFPKKGEILITIRDEDVHLHVVRGTIAIRGKTLIVTENDKPIHEHFRATLFKGRLAKQGELLPKGANVRQLKADAASSKQHYKKDQLIRLKGGTPAIFAAAKIKALEAKLTLDFIPPATTGDAPYTILQVKRLPSAGALTITSARDIECRPNEPKPHADDFIVLQQGAFEGVYQVKAGASDRQFRTDRAMDASLVTAAKATWYPATRWEKLGTWNGFQHGKTLEYIPFASGRAPSAGPILFNNGNNKRFGGRNVVARLSDELLFGQDLPGGHVDHEITVFSKADELETDVRVKVTRVLKIEEPAVRRTALAKSPVLELMQLRASSITSGTSAAVTDGTVVMQSIHWDGTKLSTTQFNDPKFPKKIGGTFAPYPGQQVVLREHGTQDIQLAVVDRLTFTVRFDRIPALPAKMLGPNTKFELIRVQEQGLYFQAKRKDARHLVLQPKSYLTTATNQFDTNPPGIRTRNTWLPRFRKGQMVRLVWRKGTTQDMEIYRIEEVHGSTLSLAGGQTIPAGQDHYAVCQLEAVDPFTGTYRAGIHGKRMGAKEYQFEVWRPSGINLDTYVITAGNNAAPVVVKTRKSFAITFKKPANFASGKRLDIVVPRWDHAPFFTGYHQILEDEWFFPNLHLMPGTHRVLVKSFLQPKAGSDISGKFSSGTNLVPADESDTVELDSHENLVTHELQHTLQSIAWGPLWFTAIPLFLFDTVALASGEGLETAEFSAFVDGILETDSGIRRLRIPNPGNIGFAKDRSVQIVQNANTQSQKLGDFANGSFRLGGPVSLNNGRVAVRLKRKESTAKLALAHAILELLTVGGVQTAALGPALNLLPWSIAQIVHGCNNKPAGRFQQPTFFPATVPDGNNPFIIDVPPKDGDPHPFAIHDRLEISVNKTQSEHIVTAVNGQAVSLDKPARFSGTNRELKVGKIGEKHPMKQVVDKAADFFGTRDLRWFFDPLGQLFYAADPNDKGSLDWTLSVLRPFYSTTSWSGASLGWFFFDIAYTTALGKDYYSFLEQGASEVSGRLYSPVGRLRGDLEYVGDLARYQHYYDASLGRRQSISFNRLGDYEIEISSASVGPGEPDLLSLSFFIGQEIEARWKVDGNKRQQLFEITHIYKTYGVTPKFRLKLETIPGTDSVSGIPANQTDYRIVSFFFRRFWEGSLFERQGVHGPGVKQKDFLRVLPFRTDSAHSQEPNLKFESGPNSSQALPHQLFEKSHHIAENFPRFNPKGFAPTPLGRIPLSPTNERTGGMYVSFCKPSNQPHRVTIANEFPTRDAAERGRRAHRVCGTERQTLFFDKHVKDVSIFLDDQPIHHELVLAVCQKVRLTVKPEKKRNYQLTVADPQGDPVARNVGEMHILAQNTAGETTVEIARAFDGKSPPTHLNLPFVVPVRHLKVKVVDTLGLRDAPSPNAAFISRDAKPGDRFFLVSPAKVRTADLTSVEKRTPVVAPVGDRLDPQTKITPVAREDLAPETRKILGPGRVYRIDFQSHEPPEDPTTIAWDLVVEAGQKSTPKTVVGTLKYAVKWVPHFQLQSHPTANIFMVVQLPGQKLVLKPHPVDVAITDAIVITAKDKSIANPSAMFDVTVKDQGKTLEIMTNSQTVKGSFHFLVTHKDHPERKARRTIQVI